MKKIIVLVLMAGILGACSPKSALEGLVPTVPLPPIDGWEKFSESPLKGNLFGQEWAAKLAVATPFSDENKQLLVSFYAEDFVDVCSRALNPKKSLATVVIPKDYTEREYVWDISTGPGEGSPVEFIQTVPTPENIMTSQSKVRIRGIDQEGFDISVYAKGYEEEGSVSQINGQIHVIDCTKMMEFAD